MANALNIRVGFTDNFSKGFKKFERGLRRNVSKFNSFATNAVYGVTVPLAAAGAAAVKSASEIERLEVAFKALTGDAEKGAYWFEKLVTFSSQTPLAVEGILKSVNVMQGFGMSVEQAAGSMKLLGDMAVLSGGDINLMSIAFGQAFAEGRAMTRDLTQLVNQGIPIWGALSAVTGATTSQLRDMAAEGKITFELMYLAMSKLTGEGGRFQDGLKKQSQTLFGVITTFMDRIKLAMAALGNMVSNNLGLKGFLDDLGLTILALSQTIAELPPETTRAITSFLAWTAAAPIILKVLALIAKGTMKVMDGFKGIFKHFRNFKKLSGAGKLMSIAGIILAIAAAIVYFYGKVDWLTRAVDGVVLSIENMWNRMKEVWEKIKGGWQNLKDGNIAEGLGDIFAGTMEGLGTVITSPIEMAAVAIRAQNVDENGEYWGKGKGAEFGNGFMDGLTNVMGSLKDTVLGAIDIGDMTALDVLEQFEKNKNALKNATTTVDAPDFNSFKRDQVAIMDLMGISSDQVHKNVVAISGGLKAMSNDFEHLAEKASKAFDKMYEKWGFAFENLMANPMRAFFEEMFMDNDEQLNAFDIFIKTMIDMLKQLAVQLLTMITLAAIFKAIMPSLGWAGAFGKASKLSGGMAQGVFGLFGGQQASGDGIQTRSNSVQVFGKLDGRDIQLSSQRYTQTSTRQRLGG